MRKQIAAALLLPMMLMLSSCDLLPEEEAVRSVTVVRSQDQTDYKTAEVVRGDLVHKRNLYCAYVPLRTDALSFGIGGEYVDELFVMVGDQVKAGQLLAQLEMSDIEEKITASNRSIEEIGMEIGYLRMEEDLAIRRQQILLEESDDQTIEEALDGIREQYEIRRVSLEDSLKIQQMQLADYEQEKALRQIRAPYDGTITYAREFSEGEMSHVRDRVFTIVDSSMSIFKADTEFWEYMPVGKEFTISFKGESYRAVVTPAEALGLEAEEYKQGRYGRVYLKPLDMVLGMKDNDSGTLEVIFDAREDVLMIPLTAIATVDGQTVVYYVGEDSTKRCKPVVTGLQANSMVEIIEGLEEGECVIVSY